MKLDYDFRDKVKSYEVQDKQTQEMKPVYYLPWAFTYAMAGRPEQRMVEFGGSLVREVFNGAVVAVEQRLPDSDDWQRMYLPVQNGGFKSMLAQSVSSRDVTDALARARAKVAAAVTGTGLDMYAGYCGDGKGFLHDLGITPETDLVEASVLVSEKGKDEKKPSNQTYDYLSWAIALAAARITDPTFLWQVEDREIVDQESGEVMQVPWIKSGSGYSVGVTVRYRQQYRTEWLPITGYREVLTRQGKKWMDNQPLTDPDANDWNRCVMRCLAKSISMATGYGLSIYAKDDLSNLPNAKETPHSNNQRQTPPARTPSPAQVPNRGTEPASEPHAQAANVDEKAELISVVSKMASEAGSSMTDVMGWLSVHDLKDATVVQLQRARDALARRIKRADPAVKSAAA